MNFPSNPSSHVQTRAKSCYNKTSSQGSNNLNLQQLTPKQRGLEPALRSGRLRTNHG